MIENKCIKIVKKNKFDKDWALFQEYELDLFKNPLYEETYIPTIIKLITFADELNLILSKPCLSSKIIEEIVWANKYTKVNIIAKSTNIIKKYSNIKFTKVTIDNKIDFNYFGIKGKDNKYFIINDGYIEVDDTIEKKYFSNIKLKNNVLFSKNVSKIIIIDSKAEFKELELVKMAGKTKINCLYVINIKAFNKDVFDIAVKNSLNLFISDKTNNGLIMLLKNGDIKKISLLDDELPYIYSIPTIRDYIGKLYINDSKIKANANLFICLDGIIKSLNIVSKKIIKIDVPIKHMRDFVDDKFDSSIAESHNDYSSEAKSVEYQFTLIPPIFDKTYKVSKIYDEVISLIDEWNGSQIIDFENIKKDYFDYADEDFGIINLLDKSVSFTKSLNKSKLEYDFVDFNKEIKNTIQLFENLNENLLNVCKEMHNKTNDMSLSNKFDKFDAEIIRYDQLILEKESLIKNGIDKFKNEKRIEDLKNKRDNLLNLKEKFITSSSKINDKSQIEFIDYCCKILSNDKKEICSDSLVNVIKISNESRIFKLYSFIDKYLLNIKQYIDTSLNILFKLNEICIPETYKVYEKNKKRYIVIDDISEYESTKDLCKQFNLECLVRR